MKITAVTTPRVEADSTSVQSLLDLHLDDLPNGAIVVVTSKIVSLCEGRVVQPAEASKAQLIEQESERYLTSPGVHCSSSRSHTTRLFPQPGSTSPTSAAATCCGLPTRKRAPTPSDTTSERSSAELASA